MDGRVTTCFRLLTWAITAALAPTRATAFGQPPQQPAQSPIPASSVPVGPQAPLPSVPAFPPVPATLRAGTAVILRVRQVLPRDGFSPGERLLSGHPAIQPGDHFLAEVVKPPSTPPVLVVGTIVKVSPPRKFGRPGRIALQVAQLVETPDGKSQPIPWQFDTEDRSVATRSHRALLAAVLAVEGAGFGASLGSQWLTTVMKIPIIVGGAAGAGLILGLGYASFQRGTEATLEPGDSFEVVVGTTSYRPVPKEALWKLYPAPEPSIAKEKHKP